MKTTFSFDAAKIQSIAALFFMFCNETRSRNRSQRVLERGW